MKATLIYRGDKDYKLYVNETTYATTSNSPYKKLSKQNCDEIFGIVDLMKLAEENSHKYYDVKTTDWHCNYNGFFSGFQKAMELNKDKVFTIEDVVQLASILISNPYERSGKTAQELVDAYIESLQKPTEIEVEIVMESVVVGQCHCPCHKGLEIIHIMACCNPKHFEQPKFDSEGCIILKKI